MKKILNFLFGRIFDFLFDLIYKPLYPASNKRMYAICALITSALALVYYFAYQDKRDNLLPYYVKGEISRLAVFSSSGVGRTSGSNTIYYFKVKGYEATFLISNGILINGLNSSIIKKGNYLELGIDKRELWRLPIDDDSYAARIDPIGLRVNGKEVVTVFDSIFDYFYDKYLYISIPLFFYYMGIVLFSLPILFRKKARTKN